MKGRLQQFLSAEQLSPARLSEILGIQRSGLSHILSGRNMPSYDFINRLCIKFPSLNPDWLITGRGKMYREQISSYSSEKVNIEKPENPYQKSDYLSFEENNATSEPSENEKITTIREDGNKKKSPVKILVLYSDGTFDDFNPGYGSQRD